MSTRINEIKMDIDDLSSLLEHAKRQKSKDVLSLELRKLQTEIINLQNQMSTDQKTSSVKSTVDSDAKCYDIKLNNYAWSQTNDFVKLYITLNKVQSLPKEAVFCNFTDQSMDLHIQGLDNKNYVLTINNLCEDIEPSKSYVKVKSDLIVVYLSKKVKQSWSCVTSVEKKLKKAKTNALNSDDPNTNLMDLMKKMFQEGDDEVKRTMAKVWTESLEKRGSDFNMPM